MPTLLRGAKYLKAPQPRGTSRFSYELKNLGISALDNNPTSDPLIDQSKMTATGVLATTMRDREGDIFEVGGIDTFNHQRNPIVLLDHGQFYPLPIGKNADPDGNYTVVIDPELGEVLQTTYFSQHSEVAEQVFHLICEKILRANSIGYRALETERIPSDPRAGHPAGKWIKRAEMIEATWCGIPCNPDAVTAALSRNKIDGKAIAPAIKAMLKPFALPKKIWTSVTPISSPPVIRSASEKTSHETPPTEGKAVSAKPTQSKQKTVPQGTHDIPADKPREQNVPVRSKAIPEDEERLPVDETGGGDGEGEEDELEGKDHLEEAESSDEPFGAEVLRDFHGDLQQVQSQYEQAARKLDNEKVKKALPKLLEDMAALRGDIADIFSAAYPDLDPLGGEEEGDVEAAETEADDEPEIEEPEDVEPAEEREQEKSLKGFDQKRLNKAHAEALSELKDMLDEMKNLPGIDAKTKSALKYHHRTLDELLEKAVPKDTQEEGVPDGGGDGVGELDEKSLKAVEEAIEKRERLLQQLGL